MRGPRCGWWQGSGARAGASGSRRRSSDAIASSTVVIDAAERSAHERRAIHLSVIGDAGSGKSRLRLGVLQVRRRDRGGPLLAPGALPLLRRGGRLLGAGRDGPRPRRGSPRRRIPPPRARSCATRSSNIVTDERERRLVEPRLAHLLRLEERPDADRADLFSGWRLFFERLSDIEPVMLVFEDLQWADSGLLDFIDYLLEWSAEHPIFVIDAGRPELHERRPAWPPLLLEPLAPRRRSRRSSRAWRRVCRASSSPRSDTGPRESRCTPSRRSGCCRTAACSSRRGRDTW